MIDIEALQESDRKLVLNLIPKKKMFEFIKKFSKNFSKDLEGIWIDKKSKILNQRLPGMMLKNIEQGNILTIKFINTIINEQLDSINKYVKEELEKKTELSLIIHSNEMLDISINSKVVLYIKSIIQTKDRENCIRLIDILLEKIEDRQIMLYFMLNQIQLKQRQKKLIESSLEDACKYREIKNKVQEKQKGYIEEKIELIVKEKDDVLKNEQLINAGLKEKILEKEKLIKESKEKVNQQIKAIEIHKKSIDNLKKDIDKLKEQLEKEKTISENLREELKNNQLLINDLQGRLKQRFEEYSHRYLLKVEEENEKKLKQQKQLEIEILKLKNHSERLISDIVELETEKEKKKEKLNQYDNLVSDFINNIDTELISSALKASAMNINLNAYQKGKNTNVYIKNSISYLNSETEQCKYIDEFCELISENFKKIGIGKIRNKMSEYITAALAAKMIPLIIGYKNREVAKAISCAYAAETPFIITLPAGYNDATELIEICNNCKSKVILIEGAIGQLNESVILPLLKEYSESQNNEKIILVSCEDTEIIELMPRSLFEYFIQIEIKDIRPVVRCDYSYAYSVDIFQEFKKTDVDIDKSYKKINNLFRNSNINKAYLLSRAIILSYLQEIQLDEYALNCLTVCDIKNILEDDELRSEVIENMQKYTGEFNLELQKLIEGE